MMTSIIGKATSEDAKEKQVRRKIFGGKIFKDIISPAANKPASKPTSPDSHKPPTFGFFSHVSQQKLEKVNESQTTEKWAVSSMKDQQANSSQKIVLGALFGTKPLDQPEKPQNITSAQKFSQTPKKKSADEDGHKFTFKPTELNRINTSEEKTPLDRARVLQDVSKNQNQTQLKKDPPGSYKPPGLDNRLISSNKLQKKDEELHHQAEKVNVEEDSLQKKRAITRRETGQSDIGGASNNDVVINYINDVGEFPVCIVDDMFFGQKD